MDCAINVKTSNVSYVKAVTFTPSSSEHSLGAMTPTVDGDRVINGGFDFGKLRNIGVVPARQDYDTLRIYNDTPIEFSELPVPPAGTLIGVY